MNFGERVEPGHDEAALFAVAQTEVELFADWVWKARDFAVG
jgi:hypothetical protein